MKYFYSLGVLPIDTPIYIYGAGKRGVAFKRRVKSEAPHIRINGFLSTYDEGNVEGIPLYMEANAQIDRSAPIVICSCSGDEIEKYLKGRQYSNLYMEVKPILTRPRIGAVFTVTLRCNIVCPFCFNSLMDRRSGRDWSFDDFLKAYSCIHNADEFVFGGGEPLIIADAGKMISHCKKMKKKVAFLTNGRVLEDLEKIHHILDCTDRIVISINSHDEKIQQKFIPISPASLLRSISRLNAQYEHLTLEFNTVVHRHNFFHMNRIIRIAEDLGVSSVSFNSISLKRHHSTYIQDAALDNLRPEERARFIEHYEILRNKKKERPLFIHFTDCLIRQIYGYSTGGSHLGPGHNERLTRKCTMPWNFFGVDNNGNIRPCCGGPEPLIVGNVFSQAPENFNSKAFQTLRSQILMGNLSHACLTCTAMPMALVEEVNKAFVREFNAADIME